jgi:uncharacterized protein DUF6636
MHFRVALLATLVLAGCGSQDPVRTIAGGDPGTHPAPTEVATPAPTAAPTETPTTSAAFRTPSGRLACATIDQDGGATLVCDVRPQPGDTGFPKPEAPITDACEELAKTEWGNGVSLPPTGSAYPNCSTDVRVPDPDPPILAYGETWKRAGYVCRSATQGLTCTRGEHRFFANRDVIETS